MIDWTLRNQASGSYVPVIAEIGINHNGSLEDALRLIDVAVGAGCDAVKFQKRTVDIVYTRKQLDSERSSPWGKTFRQQKNALEFGHTEYAAIDAYCRTKDICWTASAWDIPSLDFVENFQPPFHKIASAMTSNDAFVDAVLETKRPVIASTGMAGQADIDRLVSRFEAHNVHLSLMHSVSTYPADERSLNLRAIESMKRRYGIPVGYSGHEASVSPSIVAVALGAECIERHITLSRASYGSDQAASLEPSGIRSLVGAVRKVPEILGTGEIEWAPGEREVAAKLRYWEAE